jgi:hypothetical protein
MNAEREKVTASVIEGPAEFEMPLIHQAFVPFHNLWGVNSCFLRGPFDLDIETLEAGCTSGSPVVASGYHTAAIGKWHLGWDWAKNGPEPEDVDYDKPIQNVPAFDFDPTGKYEQRCLYVENPSGSNQTKERHCDHIHAGRHSTDIISETGLRFLKEHPAGQPYFLYLSFLAHHDPRTMPQEFLDLYDPAQIELPANFLPGHPFDNGELKVRDEWLARAALGRGTERLHLQSRGGLSRLPGLASRRAHPAAQTHRVCRQWPAHGDAGLRPDGRSAGDAESGGRHGAGGDVASAVVPTARRMG